MRPARRIRSVLALAIVLGSSPSFAARDTTPPTMPGNFRTTSVLENSVRLVWNRSTDNKRVKHYEVFRNGRLISKTRNLSFTDTGVSPGTKYTYMVMASDSQNTSNVARLEVTSKEKIVVVQEPRAPAVPAPENPAPAPIPSPPPSPTTPEVAEPVDEEVAESEPEVAEANTDSTPEPDTDSADNTDAAIGGAPTDWQVVFNDSFDGSGEIATGTGNNWRFETMDSGLHRAGNSGMDATGSTDVPSWQSVEGKRWSGWYNDFNNANAYRENGSLVMGGVATSRPDPTRAEPYDDNGVYTDYGSGKLYTSWLDTWSRKWVGPGDEHVVDPASPGKAFKYGYFEARINFSQMQTPGFRLSMWLMPASTDAAGQQLVVDTAYDSDGDNGVEIDIFEYEWTGVATANTLVMGIHGGGAGSDQNLIDAAGKGHNLREGWHTLGLKWSADEIVWSLNGAVVKRVTDVDLIPDVYSYFIVSREMNSGVKRSGVDSVKTGDVLEDLPYRPRDPGLYAQNIWEFRDRILNDVALIDYIRIWQP